MKMRRVAALAGIALICSALSGCSQIIVGVTGLSIVRGNVYAVVAVCPGVTTDEIHMIPFGGQSVLIPHPSWHYKSTSKASVVLGTTEQFGTLVGNKEQGLQPTASENVGGYLRFSSSDVTDLQDGQILASSSTSSDSQIVDSEGFDALVEDVCGPVR